MKLFIQCLIISVAFVVSLGVVILISSFMVYLAVQHFGVAAMCCVGIFSALVFMFACLFYRIEIDNRRERDHGQEKEPEGKSK